MKQGRKICNTLKAVRKQIAEANEIKYEPRECTHEGECAGTCPACEAEVRYLEQQLSLRRRLGRAVALVGVSVGLAGLTGCGSSGLFGRKALAGIPVMPPGQKSTNNADDEPLMGDVVAVEECDTIRPVKADEKVLEGIVEEMPCFPGGSTALKEYMEKNLHYPDECMQGRVVVTFTVEKDGSISNAKVVKSVSEGADKEALRLVNSMPKWIPGKQLGKPVSTKYTLPVIFRLE